MFEIKKILVPVDFSEGSDHALDVATALAKKLGASMELLHCYELPVLAAPEVAIVRWPDMIRALTDQAEEFLRERLSKRSKEGVPLTSLAMEGPAYASIVERSRSLPADLIVMGTHGRRGLPRLIMGSTAERVVRMADVPVLTVHAPREKKGEEARAKE